MPPRSEARTSASDRRTTPKRSRCPARLRPVGSQADVRFLRQLVVCVLVVLAAGGLPGATMRAVVRDVVAPDVPSDVKDRDGVLDVTVSDAAAGAPLRGARVQALAIVEGRAYLAAAAASDVAGAAHLAALPRGETWLLADAPGHARATSHLIVGPGARAVAMVLGPEHMVHAVVRDEIGGPVAGAELEVRAPADVLPVGARTGEDGTAAVGRLGPGPWHLTARAPGYEDGTAVATKDEDVARIELRKLGAIDVTVLGADERPVDGARVDVAGATLWPARSGTTDVRGTLHLGGLGAGSYALRATEGERVSPIELGVMLGRGGHESVVLHLGPGRFVGVLVTDGTGDDASAVPGARISLAENGLSPFPLEATTDAKGRARLGPIAPGPSTLAARADGFVGRGGVLVAEPPPPETRLALVRAGVLTGHVVDARGYPVDGATIEIVGTDLAGAPIFDDPRRATFQTAHFEAMLRGPSPLVPSGELGVVPGPVPAIPHDGVGGASGTSAAALRAGAVAASLVEPWVTRDDGTFRASPASPGRVRAVVHHPQYVETQSDVVSLAPGGEAHVEVVMHAGGTLEGRVLDSRDRPVEGARVVVSAIRGSVERATRSASDGTFAFAALPTDVVLTASVDADETQPDARMTVSIPEGGKQEVTVHMPEARDPLPVKVTDARGMPVGAAQVSASSVAPDVPLRTTSFTDRDGAAALKRARGVALRLEVSAPGFAPRVLVTQGSEPELAVELAPAESAHGEVVASRGRDAIAGAEVTLVTDLGVRRVRTDATGSFALSGLAAGPAKLQVRAAGYAPATRDVTVPDSGGRRDAELPRVELGEEGAVEGTVVDGAGNPVAGARVARDRVPTWLAVGATPAGIAVTDPQGRFTLRELGEGTVTLEAYAPDVGRARKGDVRVISGRTTTGVTLALGRDTGDDAASRDPGASGNVAVTLGETGAPVDVVVVSVADGSEAERAGLVPGDVIVSVDGHPVHAMHDARERLAGPLADDAVVTVRRGAETITLRVTREAVRR